jgi:hypothetical protein
MAEGFDRDEVRDDMKQSNVGQHGRQLGGGPGPSDMGAGGGSSGSGGYGNDQNAQNQQAQQQAGPAADEGQSRGDRFDEQAGGGRGADSVSFDRERDGAGADDLAENQRAHQDRGQSAAQDRH